MRDAVAEIVELLDAAKRDAREYFKTEPTPAMQGPDGVFRQRGGLSPKDLADRDEAARQLRQQHIEIQRNEKLREEFLKYLDCEPPAELIRLTAEAVSGGLRSLSEDQMRYFAWHLFRDDRNARSRVLRSGRVFLKDDSLVYRTASEAQAA